MTVRKKFNTIATNVEISNGHLIMKVPKIADDYAIEFAEWIEKYQGGTPNLKVLKELLELFKKEKAL